MLTEGRWEGNMVALPKTVRVTLHYGLLEKGDPNFRPSQQRIVPEQDDSYMTDVTFNNLYSEEENGDFRKSKSKTTKRKQKANTKKEIKVWLN